MKGKDLIKLLEGYEEFELKFSFTDGYNPFPNVRSFNNIILCDIGHSDKVFCLTGEERNI